MDPMARVAEIGRRENCLLEPEELELPRNPGEAGNAVVGTGQFGRVIKRLLHGTEVAVKIPSEWESVAAAAAGHSHRRGSSSFRTAASSRTYERSMGLTQRRSRASQAEKKSPARPGFVF